MSRQLRVEIVGDAASLERALGRAAGAAKTFEGRMQRVGSTTTRVGGTLTRDLTVPIAAAGVASVKTAQNFDLLISRMVGLGGVTQKQAQQFRQYILALSPKVGKGPDELANALYQIVSAGVKGRNALQALTVSAKASAAGLGDTATVADAITSVMNAYAKSGMTAAKAANVLTAAVRDGKGEADQFAPVLGKVVAVAAQLKVPFDQVAGALAQMTKLGVPAEDAATQLSATFSGLLKTTPKAEKALEAMGLSAAGLRQEIADKGLLATLQTLNEKTHGSTVAMAEAFPNVRALRGVLQLVGSAAQGTAQVFDDTKKSTNSLSTAFNAASKTDAFRMQQALAQLKVAAIQLGETLAPFATTVAHDVSKLAAAFDSLSPAQKHVVVDAALVVAALGPVLKIVGNVEKSIGLLSTALKLFGRLAGPLAAETAAIDAEIAGVGTAATAAETKVGMLRGSLLRLGGLGGLIGGAALVGVGITDAMTHSAQRTVSELGLQPTPTPGVYRNPSLSGAYEYVTVSPSGATHPAVNVGGFGGVTSGAGQHGALGKSLTSQQSYSQAQLAQLWVQAGGDPQVAQTMAAIAMAESSGRASAVNTSNSNGTVDRGLWQINSVHGYGLSSMNPLQNARQAVAVYRSQGLGAWSTFNTGAYKGFLATTAAAGGSASGSNYDPLATAAAAKKATAHTKTGIQLLPDALQTALSKATGTASLTDDEKALTRAIGYLKGQKQTAPVAAELGNLEKKLNSVHKAVADNLKKSAAALQAKLRPLRQAASAEVSSAFSTLQSKIVNIFDSQTQAMLDAAGSSYFQGGMTPLEKQLADMQAQDQLQALQDAVGQATTPEEKQAAQRQLDEYQLSIRATAERTKADQDYANAVKQIQADRALEEEKLNDRLAAFGSQLAAGKASLSDLNSVVAPFGVNLNDVGDMSDSLAYSMGGLNQAVRDLALVISRITGKPVSLGSAPVLPDGSAGASLPGRNPLPGVAVPMASGGAGRVSGPTLFFSAGNEDFAFSGEGRSFGRGGGDTINLWFPHYMGSRSEVQLLVVDALKAANRRGAIYSREIS